MTYHLHCDVAARCNPQERGGETFYAWECADPDGHRVCGAVTALAGIGLWSNPVMVELAGAVAALVEMAPFAEDGIDLGVAHPTVYAILDGNPPPDDAMFPLAHRAWELMRAVQPRLSLRAPRPALLMELTRAAVPDAEGGAA